MTRPRTSTFVGVSLDGFLARPDGTLDFLERFEGEEHGFAAFFDSVDTVLLGRKTYESVLNQVSKGGPWFHEGKRCIVMTHGSVEGRYDESAYSGEPNGLMAQLEAEGARHIYADGGVVIRDFLAAGLLDELTMTFVPVLIGEGLPLFGGVKMESGLILDSVKSFGDRLAQLRYRLRRP